MPTYSCDLRERIIAAREDGHSAEEVARLFRVSRRTVERYWKKYQSTGAVEPKQRGGYRRSCLEGHDGRLRAWIGEKKDLTLAELRERIEADTGVAMSWTLVQLWVKRLGLRLKKSRSTPKSGTAKPAANVAPSSTAASSRPTRNG